MGGRAAAVILGLAGFNTGNSPRENKSHSAGVLGVGNYCRKLYIV